MQQQRQRGNCASDVGYVVGCDFYSSDQLLAMASGPAFLIHERKLLTEANEGWTRSGGRLVAPEQASKSPGGETCWNDTYDAFPGQNVQPGSMS